MAAVDTASPPAQDADEDLEDGEIESDDDVPTAANAAADEPIDVDAIADEKRAVATNDDVVIVIPSDDASVVNVTDTDEPVDARGVAAGNPFNNKEKAKAAAKAAEEFELAAAAAAASKKRKGGASGATPGAGGGGAAKKQREMASRSTEDDWMCNVENAIAAALKRDGIEPPPLPKLASQDASAADAKTVAIDDDPVSARRFAKNKRRKRREIDKELKRRLKAAEDLIDGKPPRRRASDDYDDYDMLNVRGGSPQTADSSSRLHNDDAYYQSDDSFDSLDSYDERRRGGRAKERRGADTRKGGRKRRRGGAQNADDSDDERHEHGAHYGHHSNAGGGGASANSHHAPSHHQNHRNSGPRKLELCKFYLMECCAKREKCLYMHSDFPCKFYYLGMSGHDRSTCKFAHGRPLTDQLRNILLKHLETAPKEILGDFRRMNRETAVHMLAAQHQKLLVEFGMAPEPKVAPVAAEEASDSGVDGGGHEMGGAGGGYQKDKSRRSRWADTKHGGAAAASASFRSNRFDERSNKASPDYMSLSSLIGVISHDQITRLASIGVETLDQINQLTVAQLNELGLSISQIHEIQLNALNIQKLGLATAAAAAAASASPAVVHSTPAFAQQDLDMRVVPSNRSNSSNPFDIDMRRLGAATRHESPKQAAADNHGFDYSQYLKDSHLSADEDEDAAAAKRNKAQEENWDDDDDDPHVPMVIDEGPDALPPKQRPRSRSTSPDLRPAALLPAVYDPSAFYPSAITNKIDLSSSVAQLINSSAIGKEDYTAGRRDPRQPLHEDQPAQPLAKQPPTTFEFFNRSTEPSPLNDVKSPLPPLPRVSMYAPASYEDTRASDQMVVTSTDMHHTDDDASWPAPTTGSGLSPHGDEDYRPGGGRAERDVDGEHNDSSSSPVGRRSDKDMRVFLGKEFESNGDVDLRLPFKPVMANYIPATEIDGSFGSHPVMAYKVVEVDVPQPDYAEIRRGLPVRHSAAHANLLDPRLRKLIDPTGEAHDHRRQLGSPPSLRSPSTDWSPHQSTASSSADTSTASASASAATSDPDRFAFVVSTQQASLVDSTTGRHPSTASPSSHSGPRIDPRRKARGDGPPATLPGHNISPAGLLAPTKQPPPNAAITLDTQAVHSSDWYMDLSSKQKILVNQQMACLSAELRKFHQDPSADKVFDLTFVRQSQLLQQVLANLNTYIDDNGQFVQMPVADGDAPGDGGHGNHHNATNSSHNNHNNSSSSHGGAMMMVGGGRGGGGGDGGGGGGYHHGDDEFGAGFHNPGADYVRPMQQHLGQTQHRFLGPPSGMDAAANPEYGFRPGLLGSRPGGGHSFDGGAFDNNGGVGGGGFDNGNSGGGNPFSNNHMNSGHGGGGGDGSGNRAPRGHFNNSRGGNRWTADNRHSHHNTNRRHNHNGGASSYADNRRD